MTDVPIRTLLEAVVRKGLSAQPEVHKKWISVQYKFANWAGVASLPVFAMNTRNDMILRVIESENLRRSPQETDEIEFVDDVIISLSENWVSRSYELVRSAKGRLRSRGEDIPGKLVHLLHQLELVRMPIDKGEIAKANFYSGPPIVLALEDGSASREYMNDGSFILSRGMCGATGAII